MAGVQETETLEQRLERYESDASLWRRDKDYVNILRILYGLEDEYLALVQELEKEEQALEETLALMRQARLDRAGILKAIPEQRRENETLKSDIAMFDTNPLTAEEREQLENLQTENENLKKEIAQTHQAWRTVQSEISVIENRMQMRQESQRLHKISAQRAAIKASRRHPVVEPSRSEKYKEREAVASSVSGKVWGWLAGVSVVGMLVGASLYFYPSDSKAVPFSNIVVNVPPDLMAVPEKATVPIGRRIQQFIERSHQSFSVEGDVMEFDSGSVVFRKRPDEKGTWITVEVRDEKNKSRVRIVTDGRDFDGPPLLIVDNTHLGFLSRPNVGLLRTLLPDVQIMVAEAMRAAVVAWGVAVPDSIFGKDIATASDAILMVQLLTDQFFANRWPFVVAHDVHTEAFSGGDPAQGIAGSGGTPRVPGVPLPGSGRQGR